MPEHTGRRLYSRVMLLCNKNRLKSAQAVDLGSDELRRRLTQELVSRQSGACLVLRQASTNTSQQLLRTFTPTPYRPQHCQHSRSAPSRRASRGSPTKLEQCLRRSPRAAPWARDFPAPEGLDCGRGSLVVRSAQEKEREGEEGKSGWGKGKSVTPLRLHLKNVAGE